MVRSFPLLQLPFLAIEETIKQMDFVEQFALSMVSERSQRIVKCALRNWKYAAHFGLRDDEFSMEMVDEDGDVIPLDLLDLTDEDTEVDFVTNCIAHLTDTFPVKRVSLIFSDEYCNWIPEVVSFVKQQGLPLSGVHVPQAEADDQNDKICEFLFKESNRNWMLELNIPTSPTFYSKLDLIEPIHCEILELQQTAGLTMDHVIKWFMNCKQLVLEDCSFSCRDLNQFMKAWKEGSEIETFHISVRGVGFPLDIVLDGLAATPVKRVAYDGSRTNGYKIRQDSGREAIVYLNGDSRLAMTPVFDNEKDGKFTMVRSFPLLRLPFLAIEETIKQMDFKQKFALSMASKRSQRIVKCALRNGEYTAHFLLSDNKFSVDMVDEDGDVIPLELLDLDDEDTDVDSVKDCIDHLTDTFAVKKVSLNFSDEYYQWIPAVVLFVKQQSLPLSAVHVPEAKADDQNDKICEFLFKESNRNWMLELNIPTTPTFYSKLEIEPIHCDILELQQTSGLTMDHVIKWFMNCKELVLEDCSFSCRDLNQFMKAWKEGSEIETFRFSIRGVGFPLDTVLDGLAATPVQEVEYDGSRTNGYKVRQDSGREAIVSLNGNSRLVMSPVRDTEKDGK